MKLTKSFSYIKLGDMVRIRKISNEVYEVFINDKLVDDVVYDKRDELINYIKDKKNTNIKLFKEDIYEIPQAAHINEYIFIPNYEQKYNW